MSHVVLAPLLAALVAQTPASPAGRREPAETLSAGGRAPAVLLAFSTAGALAGGSISGLVRTAAEVFGEMTDLSVASPEQAGVDGARLRACAQRERFSCWVRALRPDYDRTSLVLPDGSVLPYSEHKKRLHASGARPPELVLLLSIYPHREGDRLTAILLDTHDALEIWHDTPRAPEGGGSEAVEDRIFQRALTGPPAAVDASDTRAVRAYFQELLERDLRPGLEARGRYRPYGALDVETAQGGLLIEVDRAPLGRLVPPLTRISDLRPGEHLVRVIDPSGVRSPLERRVEIARGEIRALAVELLEDPSRPGAAARTAVVAGGVSLSALGAALLAVALLDGPAFSERALCAPGAACPDGSRFATLSELGARGGGGGVLAAPLGYSLALAGGASLLGILLLDGEQAPWWAVAAGVAVGAASYAISAAVGGGAP